MGEQTATLVVTAVQRSTALRQLAPDVADAAIARHRELLVATMLEHGSVGCEQTGEGDGVLAVFWSSTDAVCAVLTAQRRLAECTWPAGVSIRVRVGLFTSGWMEGREPAEGAVDRVSRLRDVAHGGQVLLSSATASQVADALPEGAWLVDLGLHRLRGLSRPEPVFELRHDDVPHDFPPLLSLDGLPNNLPTQLTSFVGRADERTQVQRLLTARRLVTLAGSGGCGKTRLAVQVAADLADWWPAGVWWVDLAPVADAAMVAEQTASTMRVLVEPARGPLRALVSQLAPRRLLLCLDTCEHVLDAAADLADTLLRSCPGLAILATSREPLGLPGETVWRVPSMRDDEAVRLFADRAASVRPGFTVDAGTTAAEAVLSICRRLDGIPLAIELAAPWVRALTLTQIARGMDDRFRLLAGTQRGVVARHRTLAASMHWSHDLLEETDRAVLRRLAVFAGGFTLDAARAVCADDPDIEDAVFDAVARLVDRSLVAVHEEGDNIRYRLLDTIRQYAQDRLEDAGETVSIRDRHLDFFLGFAEAAEPELECDQDRWRWALAAEYDNLRSALEWGLTVDSAQPGRRLAAALARQWFLHGHTHDGIDFLTRAIDLRPDDTSTVQGRLLSGLAMIALGSGQPDLAAAATERGLAIADARDDNGIRARCLAISAYGPFYSNFEAARELAERAQHHAEVVGDRFATDFGLLIEACTFTNADRHEEAVTRARILAARCTPRGERFCATFARACEAYAALFTGDVRGAQRIATEMVRLAEPLGDYFTVGHAISNLAWIKCVAGEIDAGRRLMEPVVRSLETAGPEIQIPLLGLSLAKLRLAGGDFAAAAEWFARTARFAAPAADNWVVARALPGLADTLRRLGRTGEARTHVDRAVELARALGVPHALAEALEVAGHLAAPDDPARAEDLHHEALSVRVQRGLRTFYVDSIEALAGLAVQAGSTAWAVRLLAACDAARTTTGYPRPAINQTDHDATVHTARAGLGDDGFTRAWAPGHAMSLDDAVTYATRRRGTRGRPVKGWASLTRTEVEVARLVVDGLTNVEIGARLFVSRATVKTHLSHIYAKLDITNRTELATAVTIRSNANLP